MKKIYYICSDHYWIDETGKETNKWSEPALIYGYRRGFKTLEEAKEALQELKANRLKHNKYKCLRDQNRLVYDSDIIVKIESKYCGVELHIEWLWI